VSELITLEESLALDINLGALQQWLVSYYMSQHPTDEPSVWSTFHDGETHLSYHAPPDGRLSFIIKVVAPDKLVITGVHCRIGWENYCRELIKAMELKWLSKYSLPDFVSLVKNSKLAQVLENLWEESNRTFRAEAYLSTIVLLGSILEGVLLAKVQENQKQAYKAQSTPKDQNGKTRSFTKWRLNDLIKVSCECGWLDKDVSDFSHTLRDYRNLIHPNKQAEDNLFPDSGTCKVAREVVAAAFDDLING
jgi:hypothetical protein